MIKYSQYHRIVSRLIPESIKRIVASIFFMVGGQIRKSIVEIASQGEAFEVADNLMNISRLQGINVFLGGSTSENKVRINIHSNEVNELYSIINKEATYNPGIILISDGRIVKKIRKYIDGRSYFPLDIGIVRYKSRGVFFCSIIEVAVWNDVIRFGQMRTVCTRESSLFSRAESFLDLVQAKSIYDSCHLVPSEFCKFPVDVVFTWVDGSDEKWVLKKNQYSQHLAKITPQSTANREERFKSRDEIKYALRSIYMFAPFVRNIYIVTDGQIPSWLNFDLDNIVLVDHKDIFSDHSVLPTFNSHSIETRLHHIDGLSEHFLYMNDDMFLGCMTRKEDYFDPNGIAKIFSEPQHIVPELIGDDAEEYLHAGVNAINLLEADFGTRPSRLMMHAPYAVRRSVMYEIEARYDAYFKSTSSSRFRSKDDVAPISFLYAHYANLTGRAVFSHIGHEYMALWSPSLAIRLKRLLRKRVSATFCLNDAGVKGRYSQKIDKLVAVFLDEYFPMKSPFER